jgi:hypothetical protein
MSRYFEYGEPVKIALVENKPEEKSYFVAYHETEKKFLKQSIAPNHKNNWTSKLKMAARFINYESLENMLISRGFRIE